MTGWALAELLARAGATAALVFALTLTVGRFGAAVGGILAGLPMVLGPGFVFLALEHDAAFVSAAAAASLVALCGNQFFLLAYMGLSRGHSPFVPMLAAAGIWIAASILLRPLGLPAMIAAPLFAALTILARTLGRRFRSPLARRPEGGRLAIVAVRALAAGLLVAFGTLAARWMGPAVAGIVLTFPIGFATLCFSVHRDFGADTVIEAAYAATLGMASLAVFSLAVALCAGPLGPLAALVLATAGSMLATAALTWLTHARRARTVH